MGRLIIAANVFLFFVLTGFIVNLLKSGGSLDGEQIYSAGYSGILNYIPWVWLFLTLYIIILEIKFVVKKFSNIRVFIFFPLVISFFSAFGSDEFLSVSRVSFQILVAIILIYISIDFFGVLWYLNAIKIASWFAMVVSIIFSLFFRAYGVSADLDGNLHWQGGFDQKNTMGNYFAIIFCIFFPIYSKRLIKFDALFLCALLFLIFMSGSTTSLVMVVSSIILFVILNIKREKIITKKIISILFVSLFFISAWAVIYLSVEDYGFDVLGKDTSFSGRNLIWKYVLKLVNDSLLFGHGIDHLSASTLKNERFFESEVGFIVMTSHNGYLEAIYSVGLIGLGALFLYICKILFVASKSDLWIISFSVVMSFLVLNLMEARFIGLNVYFISIVFIDCFMEKLSEN